MKKIGIATLYTGYNIGSSLQAFSMIKILDKMGYKGEIIKLSGSMIKGRDVRLNKLFVTLFRMLMFSSDKTKFLKSFAQNNKSNFDEKTLNEFDEFYSKKLMPKFETYKNLKKVAKTNEYYKFICGSDQIWNSTTYYVDPFYYLSFAPAEKRIAYAPSFGKEYVPKYNEKSISSYLNDIPSISVREESGKKIIFSLIGRDVSVCLDPTLMINQYEWESYFNLNDQNNDYILCYFLNEPSEKAKKMINQLTLKYKLKVLFYNKKYGENVIYGGPELFLSCVKNAKYVITDSFHGVAFSINFKKQFYVYDRNYVAENQSTRIESLLSRLDLMDAFNSEEIVGDELFNYEKIYNKLNLEKEKSYLYLKKALNSNMNFEEFEKQIEKNKDRSVNHLIVYNENECCGCGSCLNTCPEKAISMIESEEGFRYPRVDMNKCINCGLCQKACPIMNVIDRKKYLGSSKCFAAKINNKELQLNSSSGGIFSAIAKNVLLRNGIVYGCELDENHIAKFTCVDKLNDLNRLMGSKYVNSDMKDIYQKIKDNLKDNRIVLFSGLPCQVSALLSFLNKQYDNLITIEIICHGTPSQKLFSKYINYLENKYKSKVIDYKFRSKKASKWGIFKSIVTLDNNGTIKNKKINADFDKYYNNFLNCNNYRESCYCCKFACKERFADFTIGDFWGIENELPEMLDYDGVSAVLVNTNYGLDLFKKLIKSNDIKAKEVNFNNIAKYNGQLLYPSKRTEKRNDFYYGINEKDYFKKIKIEKKVKSYIKIIIPQSVKFNLKKVINKMRNKK